MWDIKIPFDRLQTSEGLQDLERLFQSRLLTHHPCLHQQLHQARIDPESLPPAQESELLIELAPIVEAFVCDFFHLTDVPARWIQEAHSDITLSKRGPYVRGALDFSPLHPQDTFACLTPMPSDYDSLKEAKGCLVCHLRDKDSCAKGLKDPHAPQGFRENAQKLSLKGCPLGQKISQMHHLRQRGHLLGALAMVMVDNPLVVLSGLRICTDCVDSCIFQNHQPIDTPAVETHILHTILTLPWGVEMYALLTRWNPLNLRTPFPKPPTGSAVLVVGLGPAGLTLSHYLTQEGHTVWGVDGQKQEPLAPLLLTQPIQDLATIWTSLEERLPQGIGGVAEYGITARWDKNFLTLARIVLERRAGLKLQGSLRFGSTLTPDEVFDAGIHHIALCLGAGGPHIPDFVTSLPPGVRLANDFLTTLHSGAAFQVDSPTALQLSLPLVVIGGGLTAVDAATQAQAFYIRQVEKLVALEAQGVVDVKTDFEGCDGEALAMLATFCAHGNALRGTSAGEKLALLNQWGGVSLMYRGPWETSPGLRLNPQEVQAALHQGIHLIDTAVPVGWETDAHGHVSGVKVRDGRVIPARTVLLATGTRPPTVLLEEWPGLSTDPRVSMWGDMDPAFRGSVVKAMASAKKGYGALSHRLKEQTLPLGPRPIQGRARGGFSAPLQALQHACEAQVYATFPHPPQNHDTYETTTQERSLALIIRAPQVAKRWRQGQYLKLQQFHKVCPGVALNPLQVDPTTGLITLEIVERGASTHRLMQLQPGESISVLGPLGDALDNPPQDLGLVQVPAALNCMMHQLCGQCVCLMPTRPSSTGSQTMEIRYACQKPWAIPAQANTPENLGRLKENQIMERALWAMVRKRP